MENYKMRKALETLTEIIKEEKQDEQVYESEKNYGGKMQ